MYWVARLTLQSELHLFALKSIGRMLEIGGEARTKSKDFSIRISVCANDNVCGWGGGGVLVGVHTCAQHPRMPSS